ncbi:hypothetical protein BZL30_2186 [Mycobacterium kansasii]|uniref:Uncharacterized protein n=1 Tax=Mycobacterium kansasii TaxID=1768 RepID=A0A1V3XK15_MYCKA|nr:hypothetical protein BZL30_2186 [Mycobacterium kansasii]
MPGAPCYATARIAELGISADGRLPALEAGHRDIRAGDAWLEELALADESVGGLR